MVMLNRGGSSPLISVVTICYNAEAFIQHCLTSVLEQQFDDFEYVVIDGGSTDQTTYMIEQHSQHLAYYHSQPDRGISDAFNQGISQAKGQWVIFLNADDYFTSPTVLGDVAPFLRDNKQKDVVYGQIHLVTRHQAPTRVGNIVGAPFNAKLLKRMQNIPHPAAFHARHYFERVGLFDETFHIAMDYELYLRAGTGLSVHFIPLLISEMREGGVSKQSIRASLHEGYRAQVKHHVLPQIMAYFLYQKHIVRFYIKTWVKSCVWRICAKLEQRHEK